VSNKRTLVPTDTDAQSRIVAAALRCFSRKGFAGTSLADIETEAGFSVGAGSTYRYFASKQAMLEAAVTDALDRADALSIAAPRSLEEAGRIALAAMDDIQDLTRIVLRDLDRFPELLMPVVDRLIEGPIRAVAAQMEAAAPGVDGDAMATLLIGSLVNVKVVEALGGKRPGAVDEDRLLAAWTHLYRLALENPT
jgi:AcrR family transcriptional regulator